jgi:hypothetical protein
MLGIDVSLDGREFGIAEREGHAAENPSPTEATLLSFRFHDDRKALKLVPWRCPTTRDILQHGGSAN